MFLHKIKTPAKINIGLNVIRKREDGFHDLETIFYPINLFDEIEFEESDSFNFQTDNKLLAEEKNNLIVKAVHLLEKEVGIKIYLSIKLHKYIPIGAGLGGGSSDAAAVLTSLNKIFNFNLSLDKLLELALGLGSDVPFFINPIPSFAESRGEVLYKKKFKINNPVLIINPGIHVSTSWAFENVKPQTPVKSLFTLLKTDFENIASLKKIITNDFEKTVFEKYPEIHSIKKDIIETGAEFALMTGTGSTVFGIYKNLDDAKKAYNLFNKNYFRFIHYEK